MSEEETSKIAETPATPAPAEQLPPGTLLVKTDGNVWQAQYSIGRLALLQILRELHDKIAAGAGQPKPE